MTPPDPVSVELRVRDPEIGTRIWVLDNFVDPPTLHAATIVAHLGDDEQPIREWLHLRFDDPLVHRLFDDGRFGRPVGGHWPTTGDYHSGRPVLVLEDDPREASA